MARSSRAKLCFCITCFKWREIYQAPFQISLNNPPIMPSIENITTTEIIENITNITNITNNTNPMKPEADVFNVIMGFVFLGGGFFLAVLAACTCHLCKKWYLRRQLQRPPVFLPRQNESPRLPELTRQLEPPPWRSIKIQPVEFWTVIPITEPADCTICLQSLEPQAVKLRCAHVFHKKCIQEWFLGNKTCPLCRANIITT